MKLIIHRKNNFKNITKQCIIGIFIITAACKNKHTYKETIIQNDAQHTIHIAGKKEKIGKTKQFLLQTLILHQLLYTDQRHQFQDVLSQARNHFPYGENFLCEQKNSFQKHISIFSQPTKFSENYILTTELQNSCINFEQKNSFLDKKKFHTQEAFLKWYNQKIENEIVQKRTIQNWKYSKTKILKEQLKIMGHHMPLTVVLYTMTQNEKQRKAVKKHFEKKGQKAVFLKSVERYYKIKQKLSFQKNYSMLQDIKNIFEHSYALGKTSLQYFDQLISKFLLIKGVSATDVGMIGYFDNENCPEGWKECGECEGRFLLGAGKYINTTEDGRNEAAEYKVGDKRGVIEHQLTVKEIPEHKHRTVVWGEYENYNTELEAVGNDLQSVSGYQWRTGGQLYTGKSGGDQPHNNMPPYIVLKACKKIKDTHVDTTAFNNELNSTNTSVNTLKNSVSNNSNKINTVENNLNEKINDLNTKYEENKKIIDQINTEQKNITEIQTSIDQLKKNIENMTENINSMENLELKNSINNVKKDLENTNIDIKNLKVQFDYSLGRFSGINDTALALSIIGCIGTLGNFGVTMYQCCKKKRQNSSKNLYNSNLPSQTNIHRP